MRDDHNDHAVGAAGVACSVDLPVGTVTLAGDLTVPDHARALVLFAHGSGSSRHSPRNRFVAEQLRAAGLGTVLMDLLAPAEDAVDLRTRELRFDIGLLAHRLVTTIARLREVDVTRDLAIGVFGASTGAGAALVAAGDAPDDVGAVVSRGGRPDLAGDLARDWFVRNLAEFADAARPES